MRRFLSFTLAAAILLSGSLVSLAAETTAQEQGGTADSSLEISEQYADYLKQYPDARHPSQTIVIPASAFTLEGMALQTFEKDGRPAEAAVFENPDGRAVLTFQVNEPGLYQLKLSYRNLTSQESTLELSVKGKNGSFYSESDNISLPKAYKDATEIKQDENGNDIKPASEEAEVWQTRFIYEKSGAHAAPLSYYFEQGENTLIISCETGRMALESVTICNKTETVSYEEYRRNRPAPANESFIDLRQAETPVLKSDPSLYAAEDRTDCTLQPTDVSKIKLNTIGGSSWSQQGQYLTWKVEVPADGSYYIAVRYKQNFLRGFNVYRKLLIDGEAPFREAENLAFPYGDDWNALTLGGDEPYLFYLTAGEHEITLEVTYELLADIVSEVTAISRELNTLYRKIISITTTQPDSYRDYNLDDEIPELIPAFTEQRDRLRALIEKIESGYGVSGGESEQLKRFAEQLDSFIAKPQEIASRLSAYQSNISNLSSWAFNIKSQALSLDYIAVYTGEQELKSHESFWESLVFGIKAFFRSFIDDYDSIGASGEAQRQITLWANWGRDQVNIIRSMVSQEFTPTSKIAVNIQLSQANLFQAIAAGVEPDVVINLDRGMPVNLAARGALRALDDFDGFDEAVKRVNSSAMTPYQLEGKTYGFPLTQEFFMLFYRKDILSELGLSVPDTWEDFYKAIPTIQRSNMEIGLPYAGVAATGTVESGMGAKNIYSALLYQNGGTFYNDSLDATRLGDREAVQAFKQWVDFYVDYQFPLYFDFYNRFRSGEMPLGIQSYTLYSMISAGAPEIQGMWGMKPIPGTMTGDGDIVRSEGAAGTSAVILKSAADPDACWAFLDWWTQDETQYSFATTLESVMGLAARYLSANMYTLSHLSWAKEDLQYILEQWNHIQEIPEVVGSYYTARGIENAFAEVYYNAVNYRDALSKWQKTIDEELKRKKEELGLK